MKKTLSIIILFFCGLCLTNAQTGIGIEIPDEAAVLDITSNNKGILIPRVNLTSVTLDLDGIAGQAVGLFVFNSGSTFKQGFYFWNGAEWRSMDDKTSVVPEIATLSCSTAVLEPATFTAGVAYSGIMKITYTGGNGGSYGIGTPISSTGNTGLQAVLKSGELEFGNGTLVYDVTGTPSQSTPTGASFAVNFGTANPQSCVATVGETAVADIKNIATLGVLISTTDNGFTGYHRMITTPDGKFSVRVFIRSGENLANSDIQIRTNVNPVTIMWNNHVGYQGGTMGNASNALNLPATGIWYGNGGGNGDTANSNNTAAWGDADVYFNAPEQRSYMWTSTDVNDQSMYTLKFMLGAPNPNVAANATNVAATKAFLQITQVTAAK